MEPVAKRRGRPRKVDPETVETVSIRQPMRAEMREPDPRSAAAKRAQEILENIGQADEGQDDFRTPKAPDGWTYEWKRNTLFNQEDPAYMTSLLRTGWEPVPAKRHPEMMPIGAMKSIERKGMILMERPSTITDRARQIELQRARNQVRQKEAQLSSAPDGQFDRSNKGDSLVKVRRSVEPMVIPKD